jgi:hypothetical protein
MPDTTATSIRIPGTVGRVTTTGAGIRWISRPLRQNGIRRKTRSNVPERTEQIRPAGKIARAAHQKVASIDPVKAPVAPAIVGRRKEATCSAKRRIENAVAGKAVGSRIFSAAVGAVANVGGVEEAANVAEEDGVGRHEKFPKASPS